MNRRATVATCAALVVGVAGITPALATATATAAKHKPLKGTWSFTDFTADPTVSVTNTAKSTAAYCNGNLPDGPADETSHTLKVKGRGRPHGRGRQHRRLGDDGHATRGGASSPAPTVGCPRTRRAC